MERDELRRRHIEAVPDALVDDMHAELGLLLNIDGTHDDGVDYLNDIVSTVVPLIGRALDAAVARADAAERERDEVLRSGNVATLAGVCRKAKLAQAVKALRVQDFDRWRSTLNEFPSQTTVTVPKAALAALLGSVQAALASLAEPAQPEFKRFPTEHDGCPYLGLLADLTHWDCPECGATGTVDTAQLDDGAAALRREVASAEPAQPAPLTTASRYEWEQL